MKKMLMVLWLWLIAASVAAGSVLVTPSVNLIGGSYSYEYTVENVGTTSIIGFGLQGLVPSIFNPTSPSGWNVSTFDDGTTWSVMWVSSDVLFDLAPGKILSNLSFLSDSPPGDVFFAVLDTDFEGFEGQTVGPLAVIPIPSTFALMGICLISLLWKNNYRPYRTQ